ncbi:hypothetical protein ACFL0B_04135 [Thermodesulfobacteriota bacterium]
MQPEVLLWVLPDKGLEDLDMPLGEALHGIVRFDFNLLGEDFKLGRKRAGGVRANIKL